MDNEIKCEKCGTPMKKMDDKTLKCEKCGTTRDLSKESKEEVK